jgi:hypothetical protein
MKTTLFLAAFLFGMLSSNGQTQLPDGEGKTTVEHLCYDCHGPENFIDQRHDKDGWEEVVYTMQSRGGKFTELEINIVVKYLAKYLAPGVPKGFGKSTASFSSGFRCRAAARRRSGPEAWSPLVADSSPTR